MRKISSLEVDQALIDWEEVESPSLEVFHRCVDMVPGDMVMQGTWQCWVLLGLSDFRGLFQPKQFYD